MRKGDKGKKVFGVFVILAIFVSVFGGVVSAEAVSVDLTESFADVILTLYVHECSASGPVLSGAQVTGQDGAGNSFDKTSGSTGDVTVTETPGSWQFTASKSGYKPVEWDQRITSTCERDAYFSEKAHYNSQAAVNYAINYAYKACGCGGYYGSSPPPQGSGTPLGSNGDCAHFVSHCLAAGGLSNKGTAYATGWCEGGAHDYIINVSKMREWFTNTGIAIKVSSVSQLEPGDVIVTNNYGHAVLYIGTYGGNTNQVASHSAWGIFSYTYFGTPNEYWHISTSSVQKPTVETRDASSIMTTAAFITGRILDDGGSTIIERRFDWGTTPACEDDWTADVTVVGNNFFYFLTGLTPSTTYYFRAGAKNRAGWGWGNVLSFTTSAECPTPGTPSNQSPSNHAAGVSINTNLDWSDCSNTDYYDVYFGTSSPPPPHGSAPTSTTPCYPFQNDLEYGTKYYWKIEAKNNCGGNISGLIWDFNTEEAPNQPPTAIIDSITPDPAEQGTDTVSFTGHGTDPDGTVDAYNWSSSIDGHLSTSAAFTKPALELSVGTHTIYFKVQDNDGAWSTEDTEDLTINPANVPPTAIIDSITPDPAVQGSDTVSFTGHGADPDGTVEAYNWSSSIDGLLSTSAAFTKPASELLVGTHAIYFKVQDDDGTWSTEDTADLTINPANVAPTAIIDSITPEPAEQGTDTVSFSGHGTDPDGTVVAYNWSSSIDGHLSTSAAFTKPALELSVGTHTIYFKVQDNDGAWSTEDTEDLTITPANQQPTAIIDSITTDAAEQGTDTVSFTGHGTDTDGTVVAYNWSSSIDGPLSTSAAFTKPASELSVGTHTIYFKVQDNDGAWSTEDTADLTITPANVAPTAIIDPITPDPAEQGTDTVSVSFSGHGTDTDGTVVAYNWSSSIDGHLSTSAAFTKPALELSVGTHTIYFKVQDNDGAWSTEDTADLTITPANQQPTAIIDSITPDPAVQGTDTVSFTGHGADPDGTVVAYNWSSSIDGHLSTSAAFTKPALELSVGTHTIYFKVQDNDGAWSTEDTADLTITPANQQPTAIIDSITPDPAVQGTDTVSFTGHGADPDGTVEAYNWSSSIDGPLSTSAAFTKPASELSVGTHTIYFKVQDNDGAWSTEDTEDLTITPANVAPTAIIDSITPDPAEQETDTVSFRGHGADPNGTVEAYNWSSSIDGLLSTSAAFTKPASELSVGTHAIYFKVQDNDGTWSSEDTADLTITPANVAPTAIIDSITTEPAEQGTDTVSFTGHGADPDGTVEAYNWSSSIDGPLSTSAAFTKPASELSVGTHAIYFKVQDNDGTWSSEDTEDLTIYPGPELSYSPESHDFGDMREGKTDNTTFEIWNSGTDTLTYSLSETCDWLEVHPTSGSSTGEHNSITVDMDTTGLFEGSHTCDITINSNDGSGTFTVMVNVVPCPCGNMDVNPTSWSPTLNCSESDNEIVTVSATGGTVKGVTVGKVSGPTWLSVSPTNLSDIVSGSNKTFTMTAAPPSETSGDFGYTVTVSNTCGTPSTRDVSGTIHVDCPESSWRYKVCKWTYMVYLDGDNNLEGAAIDDFMEMSSVCSTSDVNIVVQFDRIPGHDTSYGNWEDCKRFHVTYGMTPTAANAIENLGECNMGNPNTLTEFVEWSMTEYPAENYALVLWNHGSGWKLSVPWVETKGICWDETSNDHLTLQETGQALSGEYLEVLGNDACLMQMIEVAYQMRTSAGIIVGSEETEPLDGWPYDTILKDLTRTPTMTPSTFGGTIVSRYIEYYPAETLSAMNNGDLLGLATAVDNFAQVLIGKLPGNYNEIEEARTNVQVFYDPDYIDLYHFAELIKSSVPGTESAAQAVMDNVDTVVYANAHGSAYQNAHGLTVYYPKNEWSYWTSYENTDFAINTNWDEFLMKYYEGPSDAVLSLSPESHNFGDMCEYETDSTTFDVWNSGTDTLTYSLSETCGWVDVHPTSGSSTGEHDTITIDIDTTGLFEGSHTCDISISSNGGSETFTVTVNVVSCECDGTATSCGIYPNCVNCNEDDGCYVYDDGCEERDYYCSNEVGCDYTPSNRHTDYYDDWDYYCDGDTVRRHRLFHDYYCDGGTCTDHTRMEDDQLVENCNDHDGWVDTGNTDWVEVNECQEKEQKEQKYWDYYCSGGACTYNVTGTQWVDTENTRNKPDGTICGCTARNTLKSCYSGVCTDTGICNSTCGADAACDGKEPGDSCGGGVCDSNCKCGVVGVDYGVFRNGVWCVDTSGNHVADLVFGYGIPGDVPIVGDFNKDGSDDIAIFRNGIWCVDTTGNRIADLVFCYGIAGDVPIVGDFNKDGSDDTAIFRNGIWCVDTTGNHIADLVFCYGIAGDVPLVGDFNKDGSDDIAIFRNGIWCVDTTGNHIADLVFCYGIAGDVPLVGDFNKDESDDIAIFRNGIWCVDTTGNHIADLVFCYGIAGDAPVVGDIG